MSATWNYRVTRRTVYFPEGDTKPEYTFEIREFVYMDGKMGWTEDAVAPHGETKEYLIKSLEWMLKDAQKYPVVDIDDEDEPIELTNPNEPVLRGWGDKLAEFLRPGFKAE